MSKLRCPALVVQTSPPLEVPLNIISSEPDTGDKGAELEWDEFEAASTFNEAF